MSCWTCPEPPGYDAEVDDPLPKYRNKCGCPSATLTCVSEEKVATLCGFAEYDPPILASVPPKKYTKKVTDYTGYDRERYRCCSPEGHNLWIKSEVNTPGQLVENHNLATCAKFQESSTGLLVTRTVYDCSDDVISTSVIGTGIGNGPFTEFIDSTVLKRFENSSTTLIDGGACDGEIYNYEFTKYTETLSAEDTEADALTRATETAGTACTSRYDLRTDLFDFTVRTATYSVTATNLCKGRSYQGCVRLRKRRSYSVTVPDNPDTGEPYVIAYEDVAPDLITSFTPTAANTTDGVTTVETDVALPHEQGWEYEAKSAHIWPVSAGCDCPTDYVAPEEPPPE